MSKAERLKPWRAKPPAEVVELIQRVNGTRLFLLQRSGPTSFVIREEGCERKQKVMLGANPSCSCSPGSSSGGCKELCVHILFVMIKVLRVPPSNPLIWQLFLTDRELDEVLRCTNAPQVVERKGAKPQPGKPVGEVDRKPLSEEEPCPICYEDMTCADSADLVFCRYSCGNNVHGRCMRVWSDHQAATSQTLSCPLCRGDWGDFKWRPVAIPKRKKAAAGGDGSSSGTTHFGSKCAGCRAAPILGTRYRCLVCADLSLCEACFEAGQHPQHPMAAKETTSSSETLAEREALMPSATAITAPSGNGSEASGRRQSAVAARPSGHGAPGPSGAQGAASKGRGSLTKATSSRRGTLLHRRASDEGGPWDTRDLNLGDLLAVGPAAGLGEDVHQAAEDGARAAGGSFERIGGSLHTGRSSKKALEPVGEGTGRVRSGRSNKSKPAKSSSFSGSDGTLPLLDIVGGNFGSLKRAACKIDPMAQLQGPGAGPAAARPPVGKAPVARAGRRSSAVETGDLADLSSQPIRRISVENAQETQVELSGQSFNSSINRNKHSKELPRMDNLLLQDSAPTMEAVLCGHGLGVGFGREPDHGISAREPDGPPPGETWGGRSLARREVLPSIRKGSTMPKLDTRVRPELEGFDEVDSALGGLVIGSKKLLEAERSAVELGNPGGLKGRRPAPMKGVPNPPRGPAAPPRPPAISCSFKPVHGGEAQPLVLDGQQTENSFLHVLDSFFDGPEFDPGYAKHDEDDEIDDGPTSPALPIRSSSMFASSSSFNRASFSLPEHYSGTMSSLPPAIRVEPVSILSEFSGIPLVITGPGDEDEGESVIRSPTKRMPTMPKSMPHLGGSMPESPSRYLPPWLNDDTSFDFDEDLLYSQSFENTDDGESVYT